MTIKFRKNSLEITLFCLINWSNPYMSIKHAKSEERNMLISKLF